MPIQQSIQQQRRQKNQYGVLQLLVQCILLISTIAIINVSTIDAFVPTNTNNNNNNNNRIAVQQQYIQQRKGRIHYSSSLFDSTKLKVSSNTNNANSNTNTNNNVEGGNYNLDEINKNIQLIKNNNIRANLQALYKFTRPHTIRGTIFGSIAGTIRSLIDIATSSSTSTVSSTAATASATATGSIGIKTSSLLLIVSYIQNCINNYNNLIPQALYGVLALLLGNSYIVGINQLYDYNIDKINKPFLPIASGELSLLKGWIIVLFSLLFGPTIVYFNFPIKLFYLYCSGILVGTIYSIPPFRTKQNPILAAITIAYVRGFLLNYGVYYAVQHAILLATSTTGTTATNAVTNIILSHKVKFIARFMTIFATIIAITKDLPDVIGDKKYKIETFATKLGIKKMALIATSMLSFNYIHALLTAIVWSLSTTTTTKGILQYNKIPMIGGHFSLLLLLLLRFYQLHTSNTKTKTKNNNGALETTTTNTASIESTTSNDTTADTSSDFDNTTSTTTNINNNNNNDYSISSIKLFYKHIWDLFYLEYLIYILI